MSKRSPGFTKAELNRIFSAAKENGYRKAEVYPDKIFFSLGEGKSGILGEKNEWDDVK